VRHLSVPRIVDSRPLTWPSVATRRPAASPSPATTRRTPHAAWRVAALLTALLVALAAPVAASAGTTKKIFEDCGEERIPTGFSQQAYNQALRHVPPELEEYADCAALIHKAQLASAASKGGGAPLAATTTPPPSPSEQQALERVAHKGTAPRVQIGGEVLHPGVVHVDIASALGKLPTPLLALLAFLLACALLVLGRIVHARVRAGRHGT